LSNGGSTPTLNIIYSTKHKILKGPDCLCNLFLERYFVGNLSQNSKMERKMHVPELVCEIINFEWNHVLKFLSKIWRKMKIEFSEIMLNERFLEIFHIKLRI